MEQEVDMADLFHKSGDTGITETDWRRQRKWISIQLSSGQKFLLQQEPTEGASYNLHQSTRRMKRALFASLPISTISNLQEE